MRNHAKLAGLVTLAFVLPAAATAQAPAGVIVEAALPAEVWRNIATLDIAAMGGLASASPHLRFSGLDDDISPEKPPPGAGDDTHPAPAEGGGESSEELAKKLQNPIADLISVPLQSNFDFGFANDGWRYTLNVQPVIPITLTEDLNLITRTIVPVIYQGDIVDDGGPSQFGLGDITQSFFLSPKKRAFGALIWGVGPVFHWPAATNDSLGSEKWGAGPTGVGLVQEGPWTIGLLANHIWSYAGDDNRGDINSTFLQPFVTYTWKGGFSLGFNTESTYDWEGEQWTVPLNLFASQLVRFGKLPVNLQVGGRYYAEAPDGGPEWGLRFVVVFLFPK